MAEARYCTHDNNYQRKEGCQEMTVTAKTISAHELIGLCTRIVDSYDPNLNGLIGTIIFETKNTLLIRTNTTIRQIPKMTVKKSAIQT